MSAPTAAAPLPDAGERERAATTFDRNVVVTAGAGTGKTRLLVDRLVHLLMRDPETRLTQIVALTFTNKAANEMKARLRERLGSYIECRLDVALASPKQDEIQREVRSLMERYHLAKETLDRRALEALRQIERSEIGTIHSFAATLLRLHPLESGVDPQFIEDEGAAFERLFDEMWAVWLDDELSAAAPRREEWKRVLRKSGLDELRALAFSLCSEAVDLRRLALSRKRETPSAISAWLRGLAKKGSSLLERHPEDRTNEKLVRAACAILDEFLRRDSGCEIPPVESDSLSKGLNRNLKGWSEEDCDQAQEIARVARALCQVDDSLAGEISDLLIPFAENFRQAFTREGWISFDGLLARARTLVRDHPMVREELKRRYRAILIDEFQDTDPLQYEILIYLAEEMGRQATDWKEVRLIPGKVFVVGDPKQSIYAFRRADIEAYLDVVEKMIKGQNGVECRLVTNFRSHERILNVVNGIFSRLIQPRPGLQPEYVAIRAAPPGTAEKSDPLPSRKVSIRIVQGQGEPLNGESARRLEAEGLARWLDEEVLGRERIIDNEGTARAVQPRDIAILFRKLTDVHHYIEPLRRRGLRYVVEGERHFYAVQEVIDAVNLLRAIDNPHDRLALVGVLRSPLGGLADAEIYELHRRQLLDYRAARRMDDIKSPFPAVKELYTLLTGLRREIRILPVGEAVSRIFDRLPVRLLAARSFHGEQALANLEKLRQQAEIMEREGWNTLREVIGRLEARVLEVKEEAESALAEENVEAIRILSIHKSKGLEFPVVVLAGCHAAPHQAGDREPAVLQDWSTNLAGLRMRSAWSLEGLYIAEKERVREEEEQKRTLYVAMTRARESLVLSCAALDRKSRGSVVAMVNQAVGREIAAMEERLIAAGSGTIEIQKVQEGLTPPAKPPAVIRGKPASIDWRSYAALWQERARICKTALQTDLFLNPTLLKRREAELAESFFEKRDKPTSPDLSLRIGELAHRFLEDWNFGDDPAGFRAKIDTFVAGWAESEPPPHREKLQQELESIFDSFFSSEAYRELSSSRILGREVPLLIPWDGRIMEGVIDLLYESEGLLYLADYKSDRISPEELPRAAEAYRHQVRIYSEAARRSLQRNVAGFKLIFLRLGQAVELPPK